MALAMSDLPPIPEPNSLSIIPMDSLNPLERFITTYEPNDIERVPAFVAALTEAVHWYANAAQRLSDQNLIAKVREEHSVGLDG